MLLTQEILEDPRVQAWKMLWPREWWAFEQLDDHDELRVRVIAAILADREDEALDDLTRYTDAVEAWCRAVQSNSFEAPPSEGIRRPMALRIMRMRLKEESTYKFFRVDFYSDHGWGGHFDTDNPVHVERLRRYLGSPRLVTVVAEVTHQPYPYLVVLGGPLSVVV